MNRILFALVLGMSLVLVLSACGAGPVPTPPPVILPTATSFPTAIKPIAPTAVPTSASVQIAPEVIQLRYTLLALNVHQLDELIEKWNTGKDSVRAEASERLERIDQLADFAWSPELTNGIKGFKSATADVDKALKAKDKANAVKMMDMLTETFDGVSHPFYGKWMPSMMAGGKMMSDATSMQATFLDMTFNVKMIGNTMARWSKGNDSARKEMGEQLERLDALIGYVTWSPELSKSVTAFKSSMSALDKAVTAKDAQAAQSALKELRESFDGVAHSYYGKFMMGMMSMKMSDASSIQSAFLDLTLNVEGLEASLDEWKDGNDAARSEANEIFERFDAVFDSVKLPDALAKQAAAFKDALASAQTAVKAKDAVNAAKTFADAEEAFDALAHAYYKWLATAK